METLETGAEKVLHGGFDDPYRGAGQISGPAASEGKRHVEFRKPIKNRVLRNSTRVPPVCCPDDGLDGPALPILAQADVEAGIAVHRDGDGSGVGAGWGGAFAGV